VTPREVIVRLLDSLEFVPDLTPRQAMGLVVQLGAQQTRLAAVAASAGEASEGPTLYEIPEVAERLKMDVSHVYRLAKRGELVTVKQGRSVRVTRQDLERFIALRAKWIA
jgi:excisionase family DNA binding protein